ncbi:permease [Virgibacillus sp. NKC19-3]|uniref:permease n=1 Tax=Virgibacillus saliphilus TaxID=2831674 RepID=UPI001C9A9BF5|nr:permease [Virgibacillus sp. NKC19-3]MBY7142162.1 permease [Virgibacillus sp. NKC19-3]
MNYRRIYFILGCLFLIFTGIGIAISFGAGEFRIMQIYPPTMISVICICNGYLAPQMAKQDERTTFIRQKGMFYSYFAIIFYLILLMSLIYFNILVISALHAVMLITFLVVSTVFISMVVVSKIY